MHASTFIPALLTLGLTTASAIPAPAIPLSERTLATSVTCTYTATNYHFTATFHGVSTDEKDYQNCEGGFLDNLRGQCFGTVLNWGCSRNDDGSLSTSGYVPMGSKKCVQDAIWLSQGGLGGVECEVLY